MSRSGMIFSRQASTKADILVNDETWRRGAISIRVLLSIHFSLKGVLWI